MGHLSVKNEIDVSGAAKLLGVCTARIRQMCINNDFKTAHKPTGFRRGWWKISRLEVLEKKHIKSLSSKYNPY
jgi:hypothetical protein